MHLDSLGEVLEELRPRFSSVRLQNHTAGTTRPQLHRGGGPTLANGLGPTHLEGGVATWSFDGQLPVPRAGLPSPHGHAPTSGRTAVTCFETPPLGHCFPPTYLSLPLS